MASLYEIAAEVKSCINYETGEIDTERLDALEMEIGKKIENILLFIKDLRSDADAIRAEEKALADRRRTAENHADRLMAYIGPFLAGRKFSTPRVATSWRKSKSVEVTDPEAALAWCENHAQEAVKRPAPVLDRTVLRDLIKAGLNPDGVELVEKDNLQIK